MGQTTSLAEESMIKDRSRHGRTGDDYEVFAHGATKRPVDEQ